MKKIININLSGRVIPIEDSAYEKLQAYIESLRRYFANEEGRDEIINDIESRIAELMNDKIRLGATAITDDDVTGIIASMGTVEDFEAVEKEDATTANASTGSSQQQQQYNYTETKSRGRLYRDSSDRFIGGVCSGIAHYLNLDPAVIRILFAIITIGGFGFGILAYIILWIVLPPRDLETTYGKRLYRNPDNRIIGGVAGGLAAYFNKSANTIRLIFAAPVLFGILIRILRNITHSYDDGFAWNLGFGSLTGTFMLIYIILWIILPEADDDYQKMEMRGEKVDVNRIRQNVKEGMSNMKERVKVWGEEVKTSAQQMGTKGKEMASEFRESTRRRGGIGHAIGVIFKVFFLFIAGSIAFGLFVGLIALLFGGVAWWPVNDFLWTSKWQQWLAWGTLIFFFIVPVIGFVIWIIRRVIRARSRNNYLGWTFGGLWAMGWIIMILFVVNIAHDFRTYDHSDDTTIELKQPSNGKMIVAVSQKELTFSGGFGWIDDDSQGWDISSDTLRIAAIKLNIVPSVDSQYHVVMKKYSFGKNSQDARSRAEKIQYNVTSRDSVLDLGNGYAIDKGSKFRVQNVELEIHVPVGKKIRIDQSVTDKLNSLNVRIERRRNRDSFRGFTVSSEREDFPYQTDVDYTMGVGGILLGPDGKAPTYSEPREDYRYEENTDNDDDNDSIKLQRQMEKKQRELDEIKQKLNKKGTAPSTQINKIVTGSKGTDVAAGPSSALSLVQYF